MQIKNHICSVSLVNVKLLRFVIYKVDVNFSVHVKGESCEKSKEWAFFNRLNN